MFGEKGKNRSTSDFSGQFHREFQKYMRKGSVSRKINDFLKGNNQFILCK